MLVLNNGPGSTSFTCCLCSVVSFKQTVFFFFVICYFLTGQAGWSGSSCPKCVSCNNQIVFVTQCVIVCHYHLNLAHSKHHNTSHRQTFMAFIFWVGGGGQTFFLIDDIIKFRHFSYFVLLFLLSVRF